MVRIRANLNWSFGLQSTEDEVVIFDSPDTIDPDLERPRLQISAISTSRVISASISWRFHSDPNVSSLQDHIAPVFIDLRTVCA
jgi:hypothetical protein